METRQLDDLLAFVPGVPRCAPAGGNITLLAAAKGTLEPWLVTTERRGGIAGFRAGPVPLGDVPFGWITGVDAVEISGIEAQTLGGVLTAKGRVPTRAGGSATGSITLLGLDSSRFVAALPDQHLKLAGKADIRVSITAPTEATTAGPTAAAEVTVSSPGLAFQGILTRGVRASVTLRDKALIYKAEADCLDAEVTFRVELPMNSLAPVPASLEAGWFTMASLWHARGVTGRLANLGGRAAVVAQPDLPAHRTRKRAVAVAELRGFTWDQTPLENVRGVESITPAAWTLSPLTGALLGGAVRGDFWGPMDSPDVLGFRVDVDHFDLKQLAALLPGHARDDKPGGHASVSLEGPPHMVKREVHVEQATVFGLPVADLRLPVELTASPGSEDVSVQVRESSARLAGRLVHCDVRLRLGESAHFRADLRFSNPELRAVKAVGKNDRRPPSGKLSGRIGLESPGPGKVRSLREKAQPDLATPRCSNCPASVRSASSSGPSKGGSSRRATSTSPWRPAR